MKPPESINTHPHKKLVPKIEKEFINSQSSSSHIDKNNSTYLKCQL